MSNPQPGATIKVGTPVKTEIMRGAISATCVAMILMGFLVFFISSVNKQQIDHDIKAYEIWSKYSEVKMSFDDWQVLRRSNLLPVQPRKESAR